MNIKLTPTIPALTAFGIALAPKVGPTVFTEAVFNVTGKAPDWIIPAVCLAYSILELPVMIALPSLIIALTWGLEIWSASIFIDMLWP